MRPDGRARQLAESSPSQQGKTWPTRAPVTAADRLQSIDELLELIREATCVLGTLLHGEEPDGPTDFVWPLGSRENTPSKRNLPVDVPAPPQRDLPAWAATNGRASRGRARASADWEHVARDRVRACFASVGHVGAGVFLRLLRTPGEFVSQEELARAAGVRSSSRGVVKVYICRLRNALADNGLSPGAIETGRRSYRLQAETVPAIMKLLTDARLQHD